MEGRGVSSAIKYREHVAQKEQSSEPAGRLLLGHSCRRHERWNRKRRKEVRKERKGSKALTTRLGEGNEGHLTLGGALAGDQGLSLGLGSSPQTNPQSVGTERGQSRELTLGDSHARG